MPKSNQKIDYGQRPKGVDRQAVLERELAEKNILISLNSDIASIVDNRDILQIILPKLKQLFNTDDIFICKLDTDQETLNPILRMGGKRRYKHPHYEAVINSNFPIHDGFIDSILKSKVPLIFDIESVCKWPNPPEYMMVSKETGLKESLSTRLYNGDELNGILTLWSESENAFTPHHVELIQSIADQISVIVNNIHSNEIVRQREKENETLLSISTQIAAIRNKEDLTNILAVSLKKYLPFQDCTITLYDWKRKAQYVYAYHIEKIRIKDPEFKSVLMGHYPLDNSDLSKPHEPVVIDLDTLVTNQETKTWATFIRKSGIKEFASIKLTNGDSLLGLFVLLAENKNSFSLSHLSFMQKISYQISIAVAKLLGNEEIERREAEKSLLLSISNDMALVRDKDDMARIINEKLKKLFLIDDFTIVSLQENKLTYGAYLFDQEDTPYKKKREYIETLFNNFKFETGLYDVVLASDSPVVFNIDKIMTQEIVPGHIRFFNSLGIHEIVGTALRIGNENIGILWIQPQVPNSFDQINQNVYRGVCSQISIALANIVANEEIQRKEQEKSILLSLSNEIVTMRDKNDLFRLVDTKFKELFSIEGFGIALINGDGETHSTFLINVKEKALNHESFKDVLSQKYSISDGIFERVTGSESPVQINVAELPEGPDTPRYARLWKEVCINQIVGIALRVGEKNLGCLFLHMKQESIKVLNNNLLKGVCAHISLALSNILANEKIAKQLEEISSYKNRLEEENQYLQNEIGTSYNFGEIIGSGIEIQKVYHLLSQVAFTNSTVLISGETGTGKELIARAIHNASPRKDKLMVKVNCAAIPINLIESELFGHEKGAFTGATERRIGKFELANKSTLFLDEIGEMPTEIQVKLLRALQEREIERIGGSSTIKIDVRIIAATNRNLRTEVEEGKFRSDLYYRLNVFPLSLPPLRERKDDIPELALHFMNRFAKNAGKKINSISPRIMQEMISYPWPGNIRELEHFMERSVLLTNGTTIKEIALPTIGNALKKSLKDQYVKTIKENERDHILEVLKKCNGKIYGKGGAAALLGIPVSTLNSKIAKLEIKKDQAFE